MSKTKKAAASKKKENPVTKASVAAGVIPPAAKQATKAAKGAPKPEARPKDAEAAKEAPKSQQGANSAATTQEGAPKERKTRQDSKKAKVLELLRKPDGATLKEMMAATNWQSHSVRGFISGNLNKKLGINIASTKREDGERAYKISV